MVWDNTTVNIRDAWLDKSKLNSDGGDSGSKKCKGG
jgi:hypothetical protein